MVEHDIMSVTWLCENRTYALACKTREQALSVSHYAAIETRRLELFSVGDCELSVKNRRHWQAKIYC